MAHYILDKAYKITDSGGIGANRVVVQGALAGDCVAPNAENAGSILGVTVHNQTLQNQNVSVRKAGIARVVAAGPIAVGDPVNVADATGRVQAITTDSSGFANALGFAETGAAAVGDIIEVFVAFHERTVAPG